MRRERRLGLARRAPVGSAVAPLASVALLLGGLASCSDPVIDDAISRLGDEDPAVPVGPLHRPGQPCLACHSERGGADSIFVVAGTIFETAAPDSPPAADVEVVMRDARNISPGSFVTNEAGNFFVRQSEWPDVNFPFKVGLRRGGKQIVMTSTVNREGSCAFCHQPAQGSPNARPGDEPRSSIGQVDFAGAR